MSSSSSPFYFYILLCRGLVSTYECEGVVECL